MNRWTEVVRSNEKLSMLISYGLTAALVVCFTIGVVQVGERIVPDWNGGYLPWFCLLVALEALYSQRQMRRSVDIQTGTVVYRAVEWVVMLVLLKLVIYLVNGFQRLWADLSFSQDNFIDGFFTPEYFLAILLVAFVWGLSLMFGEDLMELEGDSSLLEAESLEGLESNREAVQRRLATRLLVIGGGLVFAASFVRLDLTAIGGGAPDSRASILHVLVYFVFGLGLLSLTHLATRRAAWAWEHIPVGPEITRRWMIFSLIFLALVALVAFLLPTGYTLGFLPSISYLVGVVLAVIYGLAMLLLLPVFYVFAWLISLLGFSAPDMPVAQPIEQVLPEVLTAAETQPIAWFEALKSILFWAVIVFVIGMAFRLYLLQNQELVRKLQRIPGLAWLVRAWHWILGRARAGSSAVPKAVREGLKRLRALRRKVPLPEMGHLLRPRQLSPRQQVIFYYLALVRRGSEAVVARKPVDTPYEYAQKLHGGLSGAEQDVDALTEAFVEARYSNHLVQENQISLVREAWEHLRATLHRVRDERHRSE